MKKLSKTQDSAISILKKGGKIFEDIYEGTFSLQDIDGNDLWIRRKTVNILEMYKYIKRKYTPTLGIIEWGLVEDNKSA